MAKAITTKENTSINPKRLIDVLIVDSINSLSSQVIDDFVNKKSLFLFEQYQLSYKFLDLDPDLWKSNESYIHCEMILKDLSVVNDIAREV